MPGNGKYKLTVENRLTKLEAGVKNVNSKLDEIQNQHLHTIQESLDNIEKKQQTQDITIARWGGALATLILILQFAVKFI